MIVNINSMLQYLTAFPLLEFKKQTILAGNTSQNPQFPHQNRLVKSAVSEAPEHSYRLLSMTMTNYHSLGSPFHRQPEMGFSEAARGGIFRGSQRQDFQPLLLWVIDRTADFSKKNKDKKLGLA